ncbi:MAG: patatin-like phospholipase family protein, partial [Gammaproteobacteria bacterium]|nr:patatin-like phospholipase family protein [Gammaproteobacteria bacterium]
MVQEQNQADNPKKPVVGLILVGGGARAAYQVGVLKAINECLPRRASNPFQVICGTSAGAINGAVLAINAGRFSLGVKRLLRVWRHFRVGHVFEASTWGIVKSGAHWLSAMMLGGLGRFSPNALLDRHPLAQLLHRLVPCGQIQASIDRGDLKAFSVTASGYTSGQSFIFYQGHAELKPWRRVQRLGIPAKITVQHLLASSAIPFVFEAVKLRREYFGDGSMRQVAPISPALHLGADRVLVIGVRHEKEDTPIRLKTTSYPSLAQVAGHTLDSIFLDSLEADLERLTRINKTVSMIPSHHLEEGNVSLR